MLGERASSGGSSYEFLPQVFSAMTVSYTLKVAEACFGGFSGLLLCWRASIYKLLYKEFLLFIVLCALLSITYWCEGEVSGLACRGLGCPPPCNPGLHLTSLRLLLTQEQRHVYAQVARYCNHSADLCPLSWIRLPLDLPGIVLTIFPDL